MDGTRVERLFNVAESSSGTGFRTPNGLDLWNNLLNTFPARRGYHMLDKNIKTNRVASDYDPYFSRDTEDMERILHGFRQFPFLDESDLISRVPGRVFFGHSVHLNPNDRKNHDPREALAEFQERIDRYNNRPLGAEPLEAPQLHYLRNLEALRTQDQPSTETLNNLMAINIDVGMEGYRARLQAAANAHYVEHEKNNSKHRSLAKRIDDEIQFRKKRAGNPLLRRNSASTVRHQVTPIHNMRTQEHHEKLQRLRAKLSSVELV